MWLVGYGSLLFKPPLHHLDISNRFTRFPGYLTGFARRFWQSSYDNRGTPEQKGRVVTIISANQIADNEDFHYSILRYELADIEGAQEIVSDAEKLTDLLNVWGCAYYIPPELAQKASEYLDLREKDGYTTHDVKFNMVLEPDQQDDPKIAKIVSQLPQNDKGEPIVKSVVYIGTTGNESFIGPEPVTETAKVISVCSGESGPNIEYLTELHSSLQGLDPTGLERASDPYLDELVRLAS